ncbi:hypothetical protein OH77DRAFT_909011 [Trametes cingulata]|nr:hypothetical protein OH77DRAFT_909011 [Trametes cingulata]
MRRKRCTQCRPQYSLCTASESRCALFAEYQRLTGALRRARCGAGPFSRADYDIRPSKDPLRPRTASHVVKDTLNLLQRHPSLAASSHGPCNSLRNNRVRRATSVQCGCTGGQTPSRVRYPRASLAGQAAESSVTSSSLARRSHQTPAVRWITYGTGNSSLRHGSQGVAVDDTASGRSLCIRELLRRLRIVRIHTRSTYDEGRHLSPAVKHAMRSRMLSSGASRCRGPELRPHNGSISSKQAHVPMGSVRARRVLVIRLDACISGCEVFAKRLRDDDDCACGLVRETLQDKTE